LFVSLDSGHQRARTCYQQVNSECNIAHSGRCLPVFWRKFVLETPVHLYQTIRRHIKVNSPS